jgi:hypothetical protein
MPAQRGRPTLNIGKTAEITFKVGENIYADLARYATDHGLSVPMYVALMMNCHVRGVKRDEARMSASEAAHG